MLADLTVDAFGQACIAHWNKGRPGVEMHQKLEFDCGEIIHDSMAPYFWSYSNWSLAELRIFSSAHGRVLDLGMGVGRYSLELQQRGFDVTGVDLSLGAACVARERGLSSVHVMSVEQFISSSDETFDTVLMMGNNIGLMGSEDRVDAFLAELASRVAPGGVLLGSLGVPAVLPDSVARANLESGRSEGEVCMRSVFGDAVGEWFDYLFVTADRFGELVTNPRWQVDEVIPQNEFENLLRLTRIA